MEGVNSPSDPPPSPPRRGAAPGATYAVMTFGCKVNQYDSQLMRETLGGFLAEAELGQRADVVLVNTCSVTAEADRQARRALRQIRTRNPGALIIVAGCLARRPGADLVAEGLADSVVVPPLVDGILAVLGRHAASKRPDRITRMDGHARAFVKVQDGCDRRCSFCVVPSIRGRSASRGGDEVYEEVRGLAVAGVPEVVLCGVELSSWRDGSTGKRLPGLIRDLVAIPELGRLRLSSLYPGRQAPELLDLLTTHPKVCRHLHLPVQSGSDEVLGTMRRGYDSAGILALVRDLKSRDPGIGLTADIIVGFPGETDEDAAATERLVEACAFHRLHIFPFSARPGTPAEALRPVSPGVVDARMGRLAALGERLCRAVLEAHVGLEVEAVVERLTEEGVWRGTTGDYLPVRFRDPGTRAGAIARIRVTGLAGGELAGEPAGAGA